MEWVLSNFTPAPLCNTYSMHVLPCKDATYVMVVDINGVITYINKNLSVDLKEHLPEVKDAILPKDYSLEVVASDISTLCEDSDENIGYLATCWVVYNALFVPERYFAAFYQVSKKLKVEMWQKFEVKNAPTFCRLTTTSPIDSAQDHLYWLIFSHSRGVQAYSVQPQTKSIEPVESMGDIFPVLEIGDLPGSATRSHCWVNHDYKFSVVGFDTGYVNAAVCTMNSGTIIDRKTIKFSGPISVLRIIHMNEKDLETYVLVSSTIGPAAVWSLRLMDENYLQWEMRTVLVDSEVFDCVITSSVNKDSVFIGTYGDQLLVYSLEETLKPGEAYAYASINVASPVLSIADIPTDNSLYVLSNKGFHQFKQEGTTASAVSLHEDISVKHSY